MDEREGFIEPHRQGLDTMTELCGRLGVSPRSATGGWRATTPRAAPGAGFVERSRRHRGLRRRDGHAVDGRDQRRGRRVR